MNIQPFEYVVPGTLSEAFGYLKQPESRILVGDQAYISLLKKGHTEPGGMVVSFKNLSELGQIGIDGDVLTLGATATYAEVKNRPELDSLAVLKEALATVADPHLLNHSTVGGALYHGTLFHAPVVGALIALNAELVLAGEAGDRGMSIDEYHNNGGSTSLKSGELIRAVRVSLAPELQSTYEEVNLLTGSRPLCGLAVALSLQDSKVSSARVVLTRAVTNPIRLELVEQALAGKALDDIQMADLEKQLNDETFRPAEDLPIQENYLRHLVNVLLKRTLTKFQNPA